MGHASPAVAIRVDASLTIGVGHLARCLTLADALRLRGGAVTVFTGELPAGWEGEIVRRGHEFCQAPAGLVPATQDDSDWMRASMAGRFWSWVVVDHYGLGAMWEEAVRPSRGRVLVIDDLADRRHACDLLLDQNYLPDRARAYAPHVSAGTRLLLGPQYALIRPEYRQARDTGRAAGETGRVRRVLVSFGGGDRFGLAVRTVRALSRPDLRDLSVTVVAGAEEGGRTAVTMAAEGRGNVRVLDPQPHLATLLAEADLAIGAGGSTSWERLCVGVPAVVITVADNQRGVAQALDADQLILWLGDATTADAAAIADAVADLRDGRRSLDVAKGLKVCDGRGVERVADIMMQMAAGDV